MVRADVNESVTGLFLAVRAMYETLAISAPTVVDEMRSRMTVEIADVRLARWSRRLLEQADVKLSVDGQEHVERGRPYVVMSNHASHYDVPILFQAFPGTIRMVAKTELYRVPVFGGALKAAGFIEIDRSNRRRAIESLGVARERLARGIAVWIAPEGTRSRTGELGRFKKGGFMLAIDTQLPVLPIAITGSRNILPAHGKVVHKGAHVHVSIQPPVMPPPEGTTGDARDAFAEHVRGVIERALERTRTAVAAE
jgi:1-acyl-sn-glycerol-3-phosphate acyltransferase